MVVEDDGSTGGAASGGYVPMPLFGSLIRWLRRRTRPKPDAPDETPPA